MTASAKHVVVAVFDGLRPDLATPENTPNILRVAARGTWFRQTRSVFPSVTRVATSSIATGATSAAHGIVGNAFYFPAAIPERIFDTSKRDQLERAEAATQGRLIDAATFGDQLAKAGRRLCVVHAGSAGSAHAINPRAAQHGHWTFAVNGEDFTATPEAVRECVAKFGALPPKELPKLRDQDYCATVMVEHVLPQRPDVALVWFNEPDTSFHYLEIGSQGSLAALRNADEGLGRILDWVERQPDSDDFAIIVASDHGQISTSAAVPLFDEAAKAGLTVGRGDRLEGAMFVATGGSSGEIRLHQGAQGDLERMAHWLMAHPAVGHVFSRSRNEVDGEIEGTLALSLVGQNHARSAELMYILTSDLSLDARGLPGLSLLMPGDVAVGGGYHGGLNLHELNTVLIVSSPGVAHGAVSQSPAGIIDIAPTLLGLLGVPAAATMMGRDLTQPAKSEAKVQKFAAGRGGFAQSLTLVEEDGRRILLDGGQS